MRLYVCYITLAMFLLLFVGNCGLTPIEYDDSMLDGPIVNDTSFTDPTFLLSTHPGLDTINRETPVIICVHGYTACTFEWQEFREFANNDGRILTSLVLLGGHGRTIQEFDGTTWEDWQAPIMKEYDALIAAGFTHISLAGSSTGGTLLLEYLSRTAFNNKTVIPEEIFMIDPIIIPASKLLHIIRVVGPIIKNSPVERQNEIQKRHWYTNRPASTLKELNELCEYMRIELEDGITLPKGTSAKCFKSKKDDSVDPISAIFIYKGLRDANGTAIDVEMVDSDFHVFTLLASRTAIDDSDRALQQRVFNEIAERVVKHLK